MEEGKSSESAAFFSSLHLVTTFFVVVQLILKIYQDLRQRRLTTIEWQASEGSRPGSSPDGQQGRTGERQKGGREGNSRAASKLASRSIIEGALQAVWLQLSSGAHL